MKCAWLFLLATLFASIVALGQGQFLFNNRVPPQIDARFVLSTDPPGTSSVAGFDYHVQLLSGPAGIGAANLYPVALTDFRTGAAVGYVNELTVTVPGALAAQIVLVQVRAFRGARWEDSSVRYEGFFATSLTEPGIGSPHYVFMGTSPLVLSVPEPRSLLLAVFGIGSLLWWAGANQQMPRAPRLSPTLNECRWRGVDDSDRWTKWPAPTRVGPAVHRERGGDDRAHSGGPAPVATV